ncbi:hypothetical protein V5O48_011502 [Marasmius crinis-equi]|uniref:Uncharacterized protein n=1 Tax=Marasmius crinis-equi TaxID=585013 RepID=A0ABR3F5S0_9AGAR
MSTSNIIFEKLGALEVLTGAESNSIIRVAVPFDVVMGGPRHSSIGPFFRSHQLLEGRDSTKLQPDLYGQVHFVQRPRNDEIQVPGKKTVAVFSLKSALDIGDHEGHLECDFLRQQMSALKKFSVHCAPMGPKHRDGILMLKDWCSFLLEHGDRIRLYLTESSVIFSPSGDRIDATQIVNGIALVANVRMHRVWYSFGSTEECELLLERTSRFKVALRLGFDIPFKMVQRILTMHSQLSRVAEPPTTAWSLVLGDIARCSLFEFASPEVLYSLASSHGYFYQQIQEFWEEAYSYDRYFEPFIPSERLAEFWQAMADSDSLVSGSVALQYFARLIFRRCDLDIYSLYVGAPRILTFLEDIGYTRTSRTSRATSFAYDQSNCIISVITLTKRMADGEDRVVQVIVTDRNPLYAVLSFHSSLVMNVITANVAFCLYPHETLHLREGVAFASGRRDSTTVQAALGKYRLRGWEVSDEPTVRSMFDRSCGFIRDRALADDRTLIFPGPLGSGGWRSRDPAWLDDFKTVSSTSWSHSLSHNKHLEVLFDYGPHCTSAAGYCFSSAATSLRTHGEWPLEDAMDQCDEPLCSGAGIWEDVCDASVSAAEQHERVLSCVLSNFIKEEFESRLGAWGLTAYKLLWNLSPLFQCFRYHPKLVLVFPNNDESLLVKAIFVYDAKATDYQSWEAVLAIESFDSYAMREFALELVWARDQGEFDIESQVTFPAEASNVYVQ